MSTEVAVENKKWVRKTAYWGRLQTALDEYKNILVISVDFVGSNQLQKAYRSPRQGYHPHGKKHHDSQGAT